MIVFGGRDGEGQNLNDVWVLTNANSVAWEAVDRPDSQRRGGLASGALGTFDGLRRGENNHLIIFGGCGRYCVPVLNDLWALSNANGLANASFDAC